jgi:hypothetical protein
MFIAEVSQKSGKFYIDYIMIVPQKHIKISPNNFS